MITRAWLPPFLPSRNSAPVSGGESGIVFEWLVYFANSLLKQPKEDSFVKITETQTMKLFKLK